LKLPGVLNEATVPAGAVRTVPGGAGSGKAGRDHGDPRPSGAQRTHNVPAHQQLSLPQADLTRDPMWTIPVHGGDAAQPALAPRSRLRRTPHHAADPHHGGTGEGRQREGPKFQSHTPRFGAVAVAARVAYVGAGTPSEAL